MSLSKDEIVRKDILEHAQKLFQQFGLKKTTMDEIAEACGKAKSTLYHYFKSKEEVFDGVIGVELKNLRLVVKERVDKTTKVQDKVMTYFLEFHREILGKLNLYRLVKHEMKDTNVANKQFTRLLEFEKSYVVRILEDGYDIGEYTNINKDDIPMFAEILLAAFLGIVRYSIDSDKGYDFNKMELVTKGFIPQLFN